MLIQKVIELSSSDGRDLSRFSVNGEGEYNKTQLAIVCCQMTLKELIELDGLGLDQAIEKINEVFVDKSFVTISSKQGFFQEGRHKVSEVSTKKGKFTIYVNNQWTVARTQNFIKGMNEKFNNEDERKERLSEITVSGQKKVETLMKEFNDKFPYLQLCIFPISMKEATSKTPVDRNLTIAKVRSQETSTSEIEISIHGRKLVKNLEKEFLENYGLYVEVCYYDKDGHGYFTSGTYDDLTLSSLDAEIAKKGGVKGKWY